MPGSADIAWISPLVAGNPFVQKKEYGSVAAGTSHAITFDNPIVNGNTIYIFVLADPGAITTPAGYTLDQSNTSTGNFDLNVYRKVAGASESQTITFTTGSSDVCIIGFEWVSGFSTPDDNSTGGNNNAITPLTVSGTFNNTGTPELFFGVVSYATVIGNVKAPFSANNGYVQIGYALSVGVLNDELVVMYKTETTSGSKSFNISSTFQSAATTPWSYYSYKP